MDYAYSIFMGIFSGALLLYAGLMALTKDYDLIPKKGTVSAKRPKDTKAYMKQFAKVIALVALSPGLSALVGLLNMVAALIVLPVSMVVFIWLGTKIMKKVTED